MSDWTISGKDLLTIFKRIENGHKVEVIPADTPENIHPVPCDRLYLTEATHVVIYQPEGDD